MPVVSLRKKGLRAADLVFDPTLACREGDTPAPAARWRAATPNGTLSARIASSPPAPDSRGRSGQGLPLSRTMLSDHKSPYVGRFACDWPRLSTTDPHAALTHPTPGRHTYCPGTFEAPEPEALPSRRQRPGARPCVRSGPQPASNLIAARGSVGAATAPVMSPCQPSAPPSSRPRRVEGRGGVAEDGRRRDGPEEQAPKCMAQRFSPCLMSRAAILLCMRCVSFLSLAVRCFLNPCSGYMEVGPQKGRDGRT